MKRCALLLACSLMISGSGCCLCPFNWGQSYGAGYAPFGGGYSAPYQPACPNGACGTTYPGMYPGTVPGAYMGGAPVATDAYGYPVQALVNPLPVY